MTDKFAICNMGLNGSFIKENGKIIDIERVVDLLNELSEENEKLKIFLNELNDEVKSQSLVIKGYQNRNEALFEKIARQKFSNRMMRDNIKDYEKSIKRLRKSYEKFDEMRLRRIRFLEKRLKKNGLSIYVNDAGDV